jgi:hypothetical protein
MFRVLLTDAQEAIHKQHLVHCVRVMSVGCNRIEVMHGQQNIKFVSCRSHRFF